MKIKLLIIAILLNISLYTFGEENSTERKSGRLVSVDLVMGIRYNNVFETNEFVLSDMRAGASMDLLFNINSTIGLGADAGFYTIYDLENTQLLFDIPINCIAKLSFGRYFAFEAYGGMYFKGYMMNDTNNDTHTDLFTNAGARIVIWNFYIEADYIFSDPGTYITGAGILIKF